MKFYRNKSIEEVAEQRLREFEGKLGRPLSIPVDIELFGDLVLGLTSTLTRQIGIVWLSTSSNQFGPR